ncbi:MAG TPA: nucleotidyltransferase family protein [Terriglobales bacterium]|nr:nucleotidyltransferase family protein [Terriglobales bacterium]
MRVPDRETSKAVILARGVGKRMRAALADASLTPEQEQIADRGIKAMIPIGRPFLDYSISALADAGLREICLVIGPEHDVIRSYYESLKTRLVRISFAIQPQPLGTADALRAAQEFTASDCFLVINSDNYYPVEALRKLRDLRGSGTVGFDRNALLRNGVIAEVQLNAYATLELHPAGYLRRINEKPVAIQADALISMNCWSFTPTVYRACEAIHPSARGEYEIPSAVQYAIENLGERFRVIPFSGEVLDLSTRADIASVVRALDGRAVEL